MSRLQADAILLLTAIIWGTAFIAQKIANDVIEPYGFVGARFLVSAIVLAPFALVEARKQTTPLPQRDYALAVLIGVLLAAAGILQQVAMVTSSATHGGFLTALYVVLVPFAMWILTRERIRPLVLAAGVVSIAGAWLLTNRGGTQGFVIGDAVLIAADFVWAFWIALIAIFQRRVVRPFLLAFIQFAITAAVAWTAAATFESTTWAQVVEALPAILYTGILSGGVAFTLQIFAQRHTPAPEAALIMSLESVFAAISGALLLQETLPPVAIAGCVLILAGIVAVEVGPALLRRR